MPVINANRFDVPSPTTRGRQLVGRGLHNEPERTEWDDPDYWLSGEEFRDVHGHYPPGEGYPTAFSRVRKLELQRAAAQRRRDKKAGERDA